MAIDFPNSPTTGDTYSGFTFDGTAWYSNPGSLNGIPAGSIMAWSTSTAPSNWLICDGSAISRSTYASLFAIIGTTYGVGDGSTTFNIPDLRGRIPVGKNGGSFGTLGTTGGTETVTLDSNNLPSHTHSFSGSTNTTGSHTHGFGANTNGVAVHATGGGGYAVGFSNAGSGEMMFYRFPDYGGDHSHSFSGTTGSAGSSTAHNNLQPYQVVNYIIKYTAAQVIGDSELATRVGAIETTTVRSVALGGTGASTASAALTSLGAAAASHTHAASAIVSGTFDYARMPSGTVIQAVTGTYTTQLNATGGWYDVGLNVSIQPRFSNSRFIVMTSISTYSTRGAGNDTGFSLRILRNTSGADTNVMSDASSYMTSYIYGGTSAVIIARPHLQVNDYTGSISAINYRIQGLNYGGTTYFQYASSPSMITVFEVAP